MPDIQEMPLGRLRALCPRGPVAEKPAKDIIAGLLAQTKTANSRIRRNTVSPYDGLDQLAVCSLYNKFNSRLCRLPDNVLVRIMGFLAWDDIICLRRTTRIFLQLFGRPEFQELQDTDGQAGLLGLHFRRPPMTVSPWVWPKFPVDSPRLWVNLCTRLLGERYDRQVQTVLQRLPQCVSALQRLPGRPPNVPFLSRQNEDGQGDGDHSCLCGTRGVCAHLPAQADQMGRRAGHSTG